MNLSKVCSYLCEVILKMRRPEKMKKFSSNSNCDLDLRSIMLKHKLIQDVAIPKIGMKLYQNQSINESIRLLTTYF